MLKRMLAAWGNNKQLTIKLNSVIFFSFHP
jgi:hypothetical protein